MVARLSAKTKLKLKATTPIIKGMFNILPFVSEDMVIRLTKMLCGENNYPAGQQFIEKAFASLKHIFGNTNSNCRRAIINNLIINTGIVGQKIRQSVSKSMGFDIPLLLVITPTQRCPLKCYGCYAAEHSKDGELTFEALDKLIGEARSLGIYFFVISGGEPYIYEHMFDIFEKYSDCYFQTYTSGITLAEKDHAKKLAKLGNVLPCISIEGLERETDERRGKGHFKRILKAMANLRDAKVPFGFSGTVTRLNNDVLLSDEVVDFYTKQGCALGYYFQYMPIGREPVFDLVPTPEQRIARYNRILELRKNKKILLADFWCDGPLVGGCLAGGRRYLHINNLGHVEPCVFAQAYDMSIYDHSLAYILGHSKLIRAIRKRQPYSDNLLRPCMVIDVPECWREAIAESGAKLSYKTADNVAKDLKEKIEDFANEYARLADPIWNNVYKKHYEKANAHVYGMREKFEHPLG